MRGHSRKTAPAPGRKRTTKRKRSPAKKKMRKRTGITGVVRSKRMRTYKTPSGRKYAYYSETYKPRRRSKVTRGTRTASTEGGRVRSQTRRTPTPKRPKRAVKQDRARSARYPGMRESRSGKHYYEYRRNRSDASRRKRL